jgi:long-chain acyl-CoA synthetase
LSTCRQIQNLLEDSAGRDPHAPALVHGDVRATYGEIDAAANRLAACLLARGVQPGDRVGLLMENGLEYVTGFFGILKAGGCVVAMNGANRNRTNRELLADSGAVGLLTRAAQVRRNLPELIAGNEQLRFIGVDRVDPAWELPRACEPLTPETVAGCPEERPAFSGTPDALGAIFYTSGSTGKPRGVTLTHRNLIANTQQILSYLGLTRKDSVLVVLPFHYSYGNSLLLTHFQVGGRLVIDNRFAYPQKVIETMGEGRVTGFAGVPSTFALLEAKTRLLQPGFIRDHLPHLRYLTQAGGAMAPALTRRIHSVLPPSTRLFIMYGQTEASARLAYVPPDRLVDKLGSIGMGIPGVSLTVRRPDGTECDAGEVGEIVASGDNIMQGYWNDPAETALVLRPNGDGEKCLYTGDLARRDADGFIFIVDRIKNMIKAGANRVSAKEIEETIAELEGVSEVSVVGVPDDLLGEAIEAFVVPAPGAALSEKTVQAHCRDNLALFKIPRKVSFVGTLPRNAAGKVVKSQLVS